MLPNVIRLVSVSHRYELTDDHSVSRLGFNFGFFNRASNALGGQIFVVVHFQILIAGICFKALIFM